MQYSALAEFCLCFRPKLCDTSEAVNADYLRFVGDVFGRAISARRAVVATGTLGVPGSGDTGVVGCVEGNCQHLRSERVGDSAYFTSLGCLFGSSGVSSVGAGGRVLVEEDTQHGSGGFEGSSASGKCGRCCSVDCAGCEVPSVPREGSRASTVDESRQPGKWAASNRRKKVSRQRKRALDSSDWRSRAAPLPSVDAGFCETVVSAQSGCPSYGQALSDAEREARDTLAQRRAAENKVAKKLAEMKLASLEDEKKCQEYADLKHQRVIQWTNEATAKSQQSLDKVKSIDPSSSASQYEIRQQAKKLADAEAEVRRVSSIVKTLSPDWQELLERKAESTFNTEYVDELMALGAAGRDNGFNY